MIELKNISKSFNGKKILSGISLKFEKGHTNLVIGGSGSGKTVLMKCMVGLLESDSGEILYDGRNFSELDFEGRKVFRQEIGMVFQGGALFDSLNVERNIMFPLNMFSNMSFAEKRERVNFCLTRVNLPDASKLMPSELSGGMKKRVAIARAIATNPKYLFCDEPNSGLDPQTSILIDELIQDISEELNIITIVVTHDMNSVMGIGEKVMFIFKGEKLWEGPNTDITHSGVQELDDFVFANKVMRSLRQQ